MHYYGNHLSHSNKTFLPALSSILTNTYVTVYSMYYIYNYSKLVVIYYYIQRSTDSEEWF